MVEFLLLTIVEEAASEAYQAGRIDYKTHTLTWDISDYLTSLGDEVHVYNVTTLGILAEI